MNCLELRRRVLADPPAARLQAAAHLATCPPCSEVVARAVWLDGEVAAALAVPAPAHLAGRILGSTVRQLHERRGVLALAASLVAVSTLAGILSFESDDALALAGIDFVIEEEANAILAADRADPAALVRAVQRLGIGLPRQLGALRYIGTCPFEGTLAHHVVATTPHGKVTLLLLPERRLDEAGSARARGLLALVRPAGDGCFAVIGQSRRSLERACEMMVRA